MKQRVNPAVEMTGSQYLRWNMTRGMVRKMASVLSSGEYLVWSAGDGLELRRQMLKGLLLAKVNDTSHSAEIIRWEEAVRAGHITAMQSFAEDTSDRGLRLHEVAPYRYVLTEHEQRTVTLESSYMWRNGRKKMVVPVLDQGPVIPAWELVIQARHHRNQNYYKLPPPAKSKKLLAQAQVMYRSSRSRQR